MTPTEAYIALNLLPKIGPVRVRNLLSVFGSAPAILAARASDIAPLGGFGAETARMIANWKEHIDLDAELRKIDDLGLHVLTMESEDYPPQLKEIYDPPIVLYVMGRLESRDRQAIGIVGSRRATHYGTQTARKLAFQLAHAGLTVVSGLARGIDTAAHEGALAAHGRTIAVIGSGIRKLYPPENMALAERMAENGAVVSEFPVDYPPDRQSFPLRNRIISGMGFGLLVVEAPGRSGALISANQAVEQGRSVYAVPGPIDRPTSHGANRLIQQGAKLVMDARDILEDLEVLFPAVQNAPPLEQTRPEVSLTPEEEAVYNAIDTSEASIDDIIQRSGLPASDVSPTLSRLEMKRLVKQLPGNHFVKLV